MRAYHLKLFLALSLLHSLIPNSAIQSVLSDTPRRILHQPLFPADPPSPPESDASPPPPPAADQPFFQEGTPNAPPPNQAPPAPANSSVALPAATQPAPKPTKKVAIAVSVGIVTLGMLSALAFFLYRHRAKHPPETQKLVSGGNSQSFADELRRPQTNLLYIGTVEPAAHRSANGGGANGANAHDSPYHKLNAIKRLDQERYRPSPELQPLPPLTKPPTRGCSPSSAAMSSSSDEESRETTFRTPSALSSAASMGNDENYYTPVSRQSQLSNTSPAAAPSITSKIRGDVFITPSVPHSKRTSPKSRFSASPTDSNSRRETLPSSKHPPPSPPPPPEPATSFPQRARFSAPPPPPNVAILRSITNSIQQPNPKPAPPPPPPPPLPPQASQSTPQKFVVSESSSSSKGSRSPQRHSPPNANGKITMPEKEGEKGSNSLERMETDDVEGVKPKLKPLHWDKVRATSDKETVWDQLKSSSFQLNEDMMESLFGCNTTNAVHNHKEPIRKPVLPSVDQENRVLDAKKSQNIAILLRALNVTRDEVSEALLDGNPEGLGTELLETLVKMAPTKEEEIKLRDYNGDMTKVGTAERFLMALLEIPFAFKRVEAMLYRANFDAEVKYLRKSYQTLEAASEELKSSRLFLKLLQAVLRTGNRMNVGTNRGDAKAFKLDTLLKLADIKGTDGKTTLLHFVVQEIIRSEGSSPDTENENSQNPMCSNTNGDNFTKQGLQVVSGLSRELGDVKKAAGMDSDVLSSYVLKLEVGLEKVRLVLQYELPNMQGKFFDSMKLFLREADEEIVKIKEDERKALSHVKEVTEYFHGDAAKEEAHPLRIFMIVRDFLSILDHVCKEVGRMQDRVVGSARSFRMPANASLPVLHRYNVRQDESSDDESLSP